MPRFSNWIKSTVLRRTTLEDTDLFALVTDTPTGAAVSFADLVTALGGPGVVGVGITTIQAISQASYDLLDPPDPTTLYVITN